MTLNGKTAIVTGGAQGIGLAIAESLLSKGVKVVIADINREKGEESAARLGCSFTRTDVSSVADLTAMVRFAADTYGSVDILVNNAGILHSTPIEDITEQEWDRMSDINLKSVFFASQAALVHMKNAGWGRIVNISSLAGRMGGYANGVAYSATKAGVIGLTMAMARRVATTGVTVNAIAPGTTESDIIKQFTPEKIESLRGTIPMNRLGSPAEIAAAVSFLASPEASFITGATLDVNGGMYM